MHSKLMRLLSLSKYSLCYFAVIPAKAGTKRSDLMNSFKINCFVNNLLSLRLSFFNYINYEKDNCSISFRVVVSPV